MGLRRREFVAALGGAAAAWPLAARAQRAGLPVIGYIGSSAENSTRSLTAFRKGLGEIGYVEGQNVAMEYRWVEGHNERNPEIVADLIRRQVAVIMAAVGTAAAATAKAATRTIPIVFRIGGDPVDAGLVGTLNKPSENLTGVTTLATELLPKRLQLLHELLPTAASLGYLAARTNANFRTQINDIEAAAHMLALNLVIYNVTIPSDIDTAFADMAERGIRGLVAGSDPLNFVQHRRLIALAAQNAIATIYSDRFFFEAGGLVSYGTDIADGHRLAGIYTGRILKGEKPTDLPVQRSTKTEMTINLKVAKTLGLQVPTSILLRADEVIE